MEETTPWAGHSGCSVHSVHTSSQINPFPVLLCPRALGNSLQRDLLDPTYKNLLRWLVESSVLQTNKGWSRDHGNMSHYSQYRKLHPAWGRLNNTIEITQDPGETQPQSDHCSSVPRNPLGAHFAAHVVSRTMKCLGRVGVRSPFY